MNNDEIIKKHNENLTYKMIGALDNGSTTNPYTFEDVRLEIDYMLDEARQDERARFIKEDKRVNEE